MSDVSSSPKSALRLQLRAARRALSPTERTREAKQIVAQAWPLVHDGAHPLASYLALADEVDLTELHQRWWGLGRALWLPRVSGESSLTWHAVRDLTQTISGSFGLREPDPTQVPAARLPDDTIILVPGVAFTRDGHRLGQGRGFYDRVLAEHRGHTIGITFACQLVAHLPVEPHDQRVARVISGAEPAV